MFAHLHTHTEYSELDGLSKIPALVDRAKGLGQDCPGDHRPRQPVWSRRVLPGL